MSAPSQADIQSMLAGLDDTLSSITTQVSNLTAGVQQQLKAQQSLFCAQIVNSVTQANSNIRGLVSDVAQQVQNTIAAVGLMADQTAAAVATDMTDAGLPSPISQATNDLVQDYSSCAPPTTTTDSTTTTTCQPVQVNVTCTPCTTPPTDTTPPPDQPPPDDTTLPPPPDEIPPPDQPPETPPGPPCQTWQQCRPDDLSWLGYQADPYLSLLSADPAGIAPAISSYVSALDEVLGNAANLDDVFTAVLLQAPPEGEYASYGVNLISKG